ncbi:WD domain, G-beta repeat protein [Necator americanus]|uniref:WD domain, G-beta repeat protein n=1 Tax=Necator americanus TaxID=51031 RepID=W2TVH8_NECAM|nr:WD domain, G-beta repeat protein [Necator americanus]ETN86105.1 WD domain, G-beta repeat protein [Necator americanus]
MGECLMFGLDLESRYLSNVPAEEDIVQMLIGTHNIKMDNQVNSKRTLNGNAHAQAWNPHSGGNLLGLAVDKDIMCHDLRTSEESVRIQDAHAHRALHLDFNPNLQHVVASCGDDGAVRLWDWRKPNVSLVTVTPHAHWAWQVRFHPVHDQLILSAGSDATVVLSCVLSASSEMGDLGLDGTSEEEGSEKLEDGQLEKIEEHEESVYSCVWAAADPWTFASLSYDGRVVVSRVSRKHKYALMKL